MAGLNLREKPVPWIVFLFLVSILIPLVPSLGGIKLSAYRLCLLLAFLPTVFYFLSGKAGRPHFGDLCVFLLCLWVAVSYSAVHGFGPSVEPIGIFFIETLGAYLLGRCFIRTPEHFKTLIMTIFIMGLIMLPFAIYEAMTGTNLILDTFKKLGQVSPDVSKDRRWGFDRVQGPFEHPILMGVFFGCFIGPVFFVLGYGQKLFKRLMTFGTVLMVAAGSLSSGPLAGMLAQMIFITWNKVFSSFKRRWYLFALVWIVAYVAIDTLSTRNPFQVFISYMAFNESTAYNRIHIFNWGVINIRDNPIFGLGRNEWQRFWHMSTSFDMYWLIYGLRHGIPALALNGTLFLWAFFSVAFTTITDARLSWYRLGYAAGLMGFFMSGWTVHFWNASHVILFFFIGAGLWLRDYKVEEKATEAAADPAEGPRRKALVYTRFARETASTTETG